MTDVSPWFLGKCVNSLWIADALSLLPESRLLMEPPEITVTEVEAPRQIEKYRQLIDDRYIFQQVVMKVPGFLGVGIENFITRSWDIWVDF